MRFGLTLPHYDFSDPEGRPVTFARVAEAAGRAEALGFDSVWISDHFFYSLERYGGPPDLRGSLEPMTTLAGLATVTERVRLGTLVLGAPFRHPAILAKMATTIDLASGGRLDLGIGAGWYEHEFRAFGYGFGTVGERFDVLEETLEVLGRLFGEEPASHEGERFRLRDAHNRPGPAQDPRPPIWLGAKGGPRALRLAARLADGWNTVWRWTPEAYAGRVGAAARACEEVGRDPTTLRRSVGLYTLVGADEGEVAHRWEAMRRWMPGGALDGESLRRFAEDTLVGTPERVLERIAAFAELGVEEIVIAPAAVPFAVFDGEMVEVIAGSVVEPGRSI